MLLQREEVNPDRADTEYGLTPLSWAARNGHEGVVKMLLQQEDVNPDYADPEYGQTPLFRAAAWGREGVVEMLLERDGVNPDQADTKDGRAPLSWAAGNGHEGVVGMLLERKDVDLNRTDTEYGRTPLLWASASGHLRVVKILLKRYNVRKAMPDRQKQAPSPLPPPGERDRVVSIPLESGNANSDAAHGGGQASLTSSFRPQNEGLVEIRTRSHDLNIDITDLNSQPSLPPAGSTKQEQLLDLEVSVPASPDNDPPATEPSMSSQTPSIWPLKFPYPLWKSDTHPNNSGSTLPIRANWYWVIGSCVCLLAFLAYRKNSHN